MVGQKCWENIPERESELQIETRVIFEKVIGGYWRQVYFLPGLFFIFPKSKLVCRKRVR